MSSLKKVAVGIGIILAYAVLLFGIVYGIRTVYYDYKEGTSSSSQDAGHGNNEKNVVNADVNVVKTDDESEYSTNEQGKNEELADKDEDVSNKDEDISDDTGLSDIDGSDDAVLEAGAEDEEGLIIIDKQAANSNYASLSFAGDVSFANDYLPAQRYTNGGIDAAFSEEVQNTMKEADIFLVNNEFCYSDRGTAQTAKGYCFRAKPETVSRLNEMGVDIVSIANNHAYDYGEEAFNDTIDTLNKAGMPYVGGGINIDDAVGHIVYFRINDMKIAYIAGTQIERSLPTFTKEATEDSAGVVRCFEPEVVCGMIKDAKEHSDFVIVYPHWGTEKDMSIQADQQALAYAFIDAGADLIVGGHSHRLQGVEYYKNVSIFYSMSNFSFSSRVTDSCILNVQVDKDGIRQSKYIPCMENAGTTIQCEEGDSNYTRIISTLNKISANAEIDDAGVVRQKEVED